MKPKCGNCRHFQGETTPTGRWKRNLAGDCLAHVSLPIVPMVSKISECRSATWLYREADKCLLWEKRP